MTTQNDALPARRPPTADDAGAFLMSMALGHDTLSPADALDVLRERVTALRDPTSPDALEELTRQLPVLESLFHRLMADALRPGLAGDRAKLARAALQAQQAHARTFALVRTMAIQRQGQTVAVLHDEAADS